MDRISKALERARQSGSSRVSPAMRQAEPDEPFSYTKTKTVPVSREYLRQQRVVNAIGPDEAHIVDAYALLRTRVLQRMQQNNWKTIGITSPGARVGKSLTSVNLSLSIAMQHNYSVVLVDTDLRRPNVNAIFGIKPRYGLNHYLTSDTPIEEVMLNPGIDHFVMIPGQRVVSRTSELLSSPKMVQLIRELKSRYASRYVVFDLPPVLVGDDVVAMSPHLDAILLVVEDGKTLSDELTHAVELLKGVEIIGAVLNKAKTEVRKSSESYYY